MPTPNDVAKTTKPLTAEPVIDAPDQADPEPAALAEEPTATAPVTARDIRRWAKHVGVDCPGHGRIPNSVRKAYDDAHPTAAGVSIAGPTTTATTPAVPDPGLQVETDGRVIVAVDIDGTVHRMKPIDADGEAMGNDLTPVEEDALEWAMAAAQVDDAEQLTEQQLDDAAAEIVREAIVEHGLDPAEFGEAMEQARERAELVALNREADGEPDLPVTVGQQTIVETPLAVVYANAPTEPRPEWADVTIPEDIERARSIAVRLEQELAHTEEQLATAEAALATTLAKWDADTKALHDKITQLTVDLRAALQTASIWSGLYHDTSNELMRHRLRDEQQLAAQLERLWNGDKDQPISYAAPARRSWFKRGGQQ